jgi:endonuclease/exonuclease/phosphatase family metal-dependent hydrolase
MKTITIGTFNCENLFTRYRFLDQAFEGKHYVDWIKPVSGAESLLTFGPGREDIPLPREITRKQRLNTAEVVLNNQPDILAVQEVENLPTMRLFNTHYLKHHFKYAVLIDGNDNKRMIDVGLYSNYEIVTLSTHIYDQHLLPNKTKSTHVFSRDCLEVVIDVDGTPVTFLINHFKAQDRFTRRRRKPADTPSDDVLKREAQAARVVEIVEAAHRQNPQADYVVLGDLNAPPPVHAPDLKVLYNSKALIPIDDSIDGHNWTYFLSAAGGRGKVSKLDYVFLSPALAKRNTGARLKIERAGLDPDCRHYPGPRFPGVDGPDTEASDHCGVFLELKI